MSMGFKNASIANWTCFKRGSKGEINLDLQKLEEGKGLSHILK